MNKKEIIDKIDKIETYEELKEIMIYLKVQLVNNGLENFEDIKEIIEYQKKKESELRIKFNVKESKFHW